MQTQERDYSMKASYVAFARHDHQVVQNEDGFDTATCNMIGRWADKASRWADDAIRWADNANTDERALQRAPPVEAWLQWRVPVCGEEAEEHPLELN